MFSQVVPIKIGKVMVPGVVRALSNKRDCIYTVAYVKIGRKKASMVKKQVTMQDLLQMLDADADIDGGIDDDGSELADWSEIYTVRKGCEYIVEIAEDLEVKPSLLLEFNGGMGMTLQSKLRVGTELWVSAVAVAEKKARSAMANVRSS